MGPPHMEHEPEVLPAPISLDEKVRWLGRPESYPVPAGHVEPQETHMSWVFLTDDRVYKLKKPVRFPYLDFSTLERRETACRQEYLLNRRLAPDVYLGVAPLTASAAGLGIGGPGAVVDWIVLMRRLKADGSLEAALLAGGPDTRAVDRIAATLKAFYRHAPRIHVPPARHLADWRRAVEHERSLLSDRRFALPQGRIARIASVQRRFLATRADLLARRARENRIVDAHGDLRPEHIWLCPRVTIIDRLEFDARLRALDPLDEVAYLDMECERLGARWVGARLRRRLAAPLGDDPSSGLYLFYRSHRAMLRARLSIAHLLDAKPRTPEKWPRRARAYLRLAAADAAALERLLRTPAGR